MRENTQDYIYFNPIIYATVSEFTDQHIVGLPEGINALIIAASNGIKV